ncbi:hypothetical protein DFJ73DRAFT_854404 [Zopfochytrium polystomum]|nr:hypothetical protein DFJ73DRAFT_854404 [Zopfochytrium polystomum]
MSSSSNTTGSADGARKPARGFDISPFLISIALGQARRRSIAALAQRLAPPVLDVIASDGTTTTLAVAATADNGLYSPVLRFLAARPAAQRALASALAGALQAIVALLLRTAPALQKKPEEERYLSLIKKQSATGRVSVLDPTFWRIAAWLASREAAGFVSFFMVWDLASSKNRESRSPIRTLQNIAAAIVSAAAYRAATWAVDGRLPAAVVGNDESPYAAAIAEIKVSATKAIVPMAVLDLVIGKPSWD